MTQKVAIDEEEKQNYDNNENKRTAAHICASRDLGGGVRLGHSFAIYSATALSFSWASLQEPYELYTALIAAASAITDVLPVYITLSETSPMDLVSLPCSGSRNHGLNGESNPVARLPWFLINAAISRTHCIVGRNSVLESLLIVLQRPWCVLEICCCDTEIVTAVRRFVVIAEKIKPEIYCAAGLLLSHEVRKRAEIYYPDLSRPLSTVTHVLWDDGSVLGSTLTDIREIYRVLSIKGLRSHNPFWLRLITVCAIYLNIAFSDLVKSLHHAIPSQHVSPDFHTTSSPSVFKAFSDKQGRRIICKDEGLTVREPGRKKQLRKSRSNDSFSHDPKNDRAIPFKELRITNLSRVDQYQYYLISLYEDILRRTGEGIA